MRALLILLLTKHPVAAVPLPLVCELTSEEVPSVMVLPTERTAVSLKGEYSRKAGAWEPSRQVNPTDTGVSGGPSMTSTTRVMGLQCSSRTISTGILTDVFQDPLRQTGCCSWGLLLTSGIGRIPKHLVSSGGTEIS